MMEQPFIPDSAVRIGDQPVILRTAHNLPDLVLTKGAGYAWRIIRTKAGRIIKMKT